uniref:Shq1 C-terminal domain-containing protein n=1 Tax=Rhizochromulina marina TaxID=1034831 RepID=A0A7S2S5C4_9STRA
MVKLSATLHWLVDFSSPAEVVVSSARRCLSYPYLRCWPILRCTLGDVALLFLRGRRCVLKSLLQVHRILAQGREGYYLLNKIFVTDMIVWMQKVPEDLLVQFAAEYERAVKGLSKASVGLGLPDLERRVAAAMGAVPDEADEPESNSEEEGDEEEEEDDEEEESR